MAEALYQVLQEEVIPLYYDQNIDGIPLAWVKTNDEFHRFAGLAIQRTSHGGRLCTPRLSAGRRRSKLPDALPLMSGKWRVES